MAHKNFVGKNQIVSAGDMSQSSVVSSIVNVQGLDNMTIQINILSGTPSGTFDVKTSVDHVQTPAGGVLTAGTFIALGSSYTATVTSGSPSNISFKLANIADPYLELVYTKTGGTGTFDAFFSGKSLS